MDNTFNTSLSGSEDQRKDEEKNLKSGEFIPDKPKDSSDGSDAPPPYVPISSAAYQLENVDPDFPKTRDEAFHGLTGIVKYIIEPQTEAHPMGVLISFLLGYGNCIGRNAYCKVGATKHFPNLFAVMVGESSKARKGTGWDITKEILREIDSIWVEANVKSGLSSGEGLKFNVRDEVRGMNDEGVEVVTDAGVSDKRLTLFEGEFASVLKVANRAGNTLSTTVRDAWDSGYLSTLTKHDSIIATNAHISIIGHITKFELLKNLTDTEAANGTANRMLWASVYRTKLLPHGGNIPYDLIPFDALKEAVKFGMEPRQVKRTAEADKRWEEIYTELSADQYGLLGSITSRAEAQVLRLSLIYCLLDCSPVITVEHLNAALAVWKYCEDSARYIFGDKFGDDTSDMILTHLRKNANSRMTTTEIHRFFGNNKSRTELEASLSILLKSGELQARTKTTGGRPTTFYELNEKTK